MFYVVLFFTQAHPPPPPTLSTRHHGLPRRHGRQPDLGWYVYEGAYEHAGKVERRGRRVRRLPLRWPGKVRGAPGVPELQRC